MAIYKGLNSPCRDPGVRRDPEAFCHRLSIVVTSLAWLVAGCAVGPDYVKPKVDTPQDYRFAEKDVEDTANTKWWTQYDDPVLDQLIAEA